MKARLGDIEVDYEVSGQGPWLTLSHSLAATKDMWAEQLAALERHFTVLRYDTRGHGGSSAPVGPYTLEQLADDAYRLLQHLGVGRTHWLGLSMGGMVAQVLTVQHPEVLDRVVLADTMGRAPAEARPLWAERIRIARESGMQALVEPTLARWFTEPFRRSRPDVMARIGAMIRDTPVEGYVGCSAGISTIDTLESLRTLRHPVLVLVGAQDPATPPAASQAIVAHWPGAQYVVIDDASHLANVEQPEAFTAHVLAFLTGAGRSS